MRDTNLAGAEPEEQLLWNSYVYWARSAFGEPAPDLIVADPTSRLAPQDDKLLHALVFTTFALEYRLRSVYELLELPVRKNDGVSKLIENLERRTAGMQRKGKAITFPSEWKDLRKRLQKLLELRNKIAHGQRAPVSELLNATDPPLKTQAIDGYNALIDAIRIINVAISYDTREGDELDEYYAQLQVAPDGAA